MIGKCVSLSYLGNNKNSKIILNMIENAYLTSDLGYLAVKKNLHILGRKIIQSKYLDIE